MNSPLELPFYFGSRERNVIFFFLRTLKMFHAYAWSDLWTHSIPIPELLIVRDEEIERGKSVHEDGGSSPILLFIIRIKKFQWLFFLFFEKYFGALLFHLDEQMKSSAQMNLIKLAVASRNHVKKAIEWSLGILHIPIRQYSFSSLSFLHLLLHLICRVHQCRTLRMFTLRLYLIQRSSCESGADKTRLRGRFLPLDYETFRRQK